MTEPSEAMPVEAFRASLAADAPPAGIDSRLAALWHAAKEDFDRANQLLAKDASKEAAWIRAHIHRRRGEDDKAAEWYGKAGIEAPIESPDAEWAQLAASLLVHI